MKEIVFYEEFDPLYVYSGSSQNWGMCGFHFHKNYEIILFMCDNATMNIENRVYTVEKGDLFLVNGIEYHKTTGVKDAPYKRYVLMFDPDRFQGLCSALGYNFLRYFEDRPENFIHKINLGGSNLVTIIKLFDEIEKGYSTFSEPSSNATTNLRIADLLITVQDMFNFFTRNTQTISYNEVSGLEFAIKENTKERIDGIKTYIKENIEQRLTLADISNRFFISKHYLSHYFKKETGFSISEFIKNQKIIAAKKMLKNHCSVTETALYLGFNSDSYFIGVFKQMTGITPKKYIMEKKDKLKLMEENR